MKLNTSVTREAWLRAAVETIRAALPAVTIPAVQVSCSWPGGGSPAKRIGECWPTQASKADVNEIFISPRIEDARKVLQVLAHELAHAVDNCVHGHKAGFTAIGRLMGLEGKPTNMLPTEAWADARVAEVVAVCGAFPHRTLDKAQSGVKKQTTRQLKAECGDCGAIFRASGTVMERVTQCPCCGSENVQKD